MVQQQIVIACLVCVAVIAAGMYIQQRAATDVAAAAAAAAKADEAKGPPKFPQRFPPMPGAPVAPTGMPPPQPQTRDQARRAEQDHATEIRTGARYGDTDPASSATNNDWHFHQQHQRLTQ